MCRNTNHFRKLFVLELENPIALAMSVSLTGKAVTFLGDAVNVDGTVDATDFAQFGNRFGVTL